MHAAATVGSADVEGATAGAGRVVFRPRGVRAGDCRFDVGTAGSATLVAHDRADESATRRGARLLRLLSRRRRPLRRARHARAASGTTRRR
ncbi:MAG: hypothetical protein HYU41_27800 [Candidatus Rokubacteria bacterium]|nr:hypothetical protein [Candidatus Rokubacteria bacterium]